MLVLNDNFTFLFVNVYLLFIVNVELALANLNTQTNEHCICGSQGITCPLFFMRRHPLVFWIFTTNKEEDVSQLALKILPKKKNQSNVQTCAYSALNLYYSTFLISFKNDF